MEQEEKYEVRHEAVPGYRPVFWVILTIAAVYLVLTFVM
jgi:hypothetical protein